MTNTEPRTWIITGATSGIGRELVEAVLGRGERVAALARHVEALEPLRQAHGARLLTLPTDVGHAEEVTAAVARTVQTFGRIDVVANNAGYGLFGAVEEATDEQARALFDTNVFGVLNVLRAVLPQLRSQGSGHVVQGSSYYGQTAHPGVGLLAASKYAVEGLTDALVGELAPLGIRVTALEPGPTATAFLSNLDLAGTIADYDGTVRVVQEEIGALPPSAFSEPRRVVEAVFAAVDADRPPLRLATGSYAAEQIRTTLQSRLAEMDAWSATSAAVDAVPTSAA
ncbi:SDR family NAD(P)-dependent oxidoreductase [Actinomycetospora atypica]|uniref:SDR family NAD(P)-dependent oxidoreductase n=1 Tax=Actinomycetospora atypica TaxID=1290095 RepID=A0ABV9YN95_9PSEU